jgi:hypothetical protein
MNDKAREVLGTILEKFKSGDIPKAIAYATFPVPDIPSTKWSFTNKIIMYLSDTADARGIRQWNSVGRTVIKGSKAIYILVPRFMKRSNPDDDSEEVILSGFMAQAVFRVEDTEGEALGYEKEVFLPDLPLMERAKEWGITVSAIPLYFKVYGSYNPAAKRILLASPEEMIFFHELSHAAYERAICDLKPGQRWDQEIVAELCAQVLCRMVGKQSDDSLGNSYRYIESYSRGTGMSPLSACLHVLESVEKVLTLILKEPEDDVDQFVYANSAITQSSQQEVI